MCPGEKLNRDPIEKNENNNKESCQQWLDNTRHHPVWTYSATPQSVVIAVIICVQYNEVW